MGKVKRLLASKKINWNLGNYCGIELCETVHIHMPDFRFELTTEQFEVFAEALQEALSKWRALGKPSSADFQVLGGASLPGKPVYVDRLEVEEQTIPSIHIHLRGLSIRPNILQFREFAEAIEEAKRNLKS